MLNFPAYQVREGFGDVRFAYKWRTCLGLFVLLCWSEILYYRNVGGREFLFQKYPISLPLESAWGGVNELAISPLVTTVDDRRTSMLLHFVFFLGETWNRKTSKCDTKTNIKIRKTCKGLCQQRRMITRWKKNLQLTSSSKKKMIISSTHVNAWVGRGTDTGNTLGTVRGLIHSKKLA